MANRLDIILFGATGFTGKRCIEKLHKLCNANGRFLSWGIAGRSETKLKEILSEFKDLIPSDSVPIIIADVSDYESLKRMSARAKVIINCCGPFRFFGEPVVKACIETGTHQLDVTGEPQYVELINSKYQKQAEEKGVYIVNACGFDCIPADMGVVFLQKQFQGTLNSIELYLDGEELPPKTPGPIFNYTTWESAVHSLSNFHEVDEFKRQLQPALLPKFEPELKLRGVLHKSDLTNYWSLPFIGSDGSVIERSQRYLYETKKIRPAQTRIYFSLHSTFNLILMLLHLLIFVLLTRFKFGCDLLLKYPKQFSLGLFDHGSPTEEKLRRLQFSMTFKGEGWKEKLAEPEDNFATPPNKTVISRVSGIDPGYGLTASILTLAAIVVVTESDKLPKKGGVYSGGATFYDTTYIEQLQQNGLSFEILSSE